MKILSIDVETTWTDPVSPKQARIREIGAVLYDWNVQRPLRIFSECIFESDHPPSPKELVDLTGITDAMARKYGIPLVTGLIVTNELLRDCDYVAAHNGNVFDKIVFQAEFERQGMVMFERPWIDTKTDVPYPAHIKTRKLSHLCAELGFVNPFAHRAMFDALSTLEVLKRFNIDDVVKLANEKTVRVCAEVTYSEREKAKKAGFYWDPDNKEWFKELKESQVASSEFNFNTYIKENA